MPFHDKATFWRNEEIRLRSNFMGNRTEKKIKFFIIGKRITLFLFCENLREDTMKMQI